MRPAAQLTSAARAVRQHDRDRFVTALFAPPDRREALFALYAFNIEVSQIREKVTQAALGQIRLQWWRDQVAAIYEGGEAAGNRVVADFADTVRRFDLSREPIDRLLDARERDMTDEPPADLPALEDYAAGTSATLVTSALEVLGSRGGAATTVAHHVGIAWALTGLLRAAPFHARQGRIYLPTALLSEHGIAPQDLVGWKPPSGLPMVAQAIADRATDHMAAARRLRPDVPREAVPALLLAHLADRYLGALRRRRYDIFDPQWSQPNPRPVSLMLAAVRGRY